MVDVEAILFNYWYIWLILVTALLVWLWFFKLDYHTKKAIGSLFNRKNLLILVFAVLYYIWWQFGGTYNNLKIAHMWMPKFALILMIGNLVFYLFKYKSQMIITPNMSGCFAMNPIRKDGFVVFGVDAINILGDIGTYPERLFVMREETIERFERGAVSIARLSPIDIMQLPPSICSDILNNKYYGNKKAIQNVFYGWFDNIKNIDWSEEDLKKLSNFKNIDEEFGLLKTYLGIKNPSVSEIMRILLNVSAGYNKHNQVFMNVIKDTEEGAEHFRRIKQAITDKKEPQENVEGYEE